MYIYSYADYEAAVKRHKEGAKYILKYHQQRGIYDYFV